MVSLDGINDSLKVQNPIETMDENTTVSLCFDKELYKNMVDAKADWLYNLPQWDKIFTPEKRKELYLEQKKLVLLLRHTRSDVTIRVHAEAERNINSAAEEIIRECDIDRDPVDSGCGDGLQWWITARQSVLCIFIGKLVDFMSSTSMNQFALCE